MGDADAPGRVDTSSVGTVWARTVRVPLGGLLQTETAGAAALVAATLIALVWANVDPASYQWLWHTRLSMQVGEWSISPDLDVWINSGLMALFFFLVGLEVRREIDLGELRERRRVGPPLFADVGGIIASVTIYLVVNFGQPSAHGWGVAMSTDTAFALGVLALVGRRLPRRLRGFMLTVVVVDDIAALVVIAVVYSNHLVPWALLVAAAMYGTALAAVALGVHRGVVYGTLGAAAWVAMFESRVDPVVVGLAMGLAVQASSPGRANLEGATRLFRRFREQPTSERARLARHGLQSSVSANDRLQQLYRPWASYLIVPLFALANAGIAVDGAFLSRAYSSPITLGIVVGYVVGKPAGILGGSWLVTVLSRGRLRPPVGWAALGGGGAIAGIGFTVSLLVAAHAFQGDQLQEAKLGVLTAAPIAAAMGFVVFRVIGLLPDRMRRRAVLGTSDVIVDLLDPVDPDRDHMRGPAGAPVTLVEYADFECRHCGEAEPVIRKLLHGSGDVLYVWRHLPLNDVHPHAQLAAEASEAAAEQGAFWAMHDLLITRQDALRERDLITYAAELGLDVERFVEYLRRHDGARRVSADVDGADASGVAGTPTFFINGRRHYGAYEIGSLASRAVTVARGGFSLRGA